MKYITPARDPQNTPVCVPLYNKNNQITNQQLKELGNSILSLLDNRTEYTDIEGTTVKMVVNINGREFVDIVTPYGLTQNGVVVKIGEQFVTVHKSVVKFYLND